MCKSCFRRSWDAGICPWWVKYWGDVWKSCWKRLYALKYVSDQHRTRKIYEKVFEEDSYTLEIVIDQYKTPKNVLQCVRRWTSVAETCPWSV